MIPWTDLGQRQLARCCSSRQLPPTLRRKPRSASMRTYSSAYSGFPPARASSAAWSSAGSSAWSSRPATSRAVSGSLSGASDTMALLGLPPPQPGRRAQQLRPGGRHHQQRHLGGPVDQVVEEVQQSLVGPVQVLDHQHRRALLGQRLQEPPPGRERLLAAVAGVRPPGRPGRPAGAGGPITQAASPWSAIRSATARASLAVGARRPGRTSRMPAWALTISPSAHRATPSP